MAPGRDVADLSGLPPAVVETITQARVLTITQARALSASEPDDSSTPPQATSRSWPDARNAEDNYRCRPPAGS